MTTASFKLTEEQMDVLRDNAHAKRMSISDYLRAVALPKPQAARHRLALKKHPVSGGWYNAAPGPEITREMVRQSLEDYP